MSYISKLYKTKNTELTIYLFLYRPRGWQLASTCTMAEDDEYFIKLLIAIVIIMNPCISNMAPISINLIIVEILDIIIHEKH